MAKKAKVTGAELEKLGVMTFNCDRCRELFPRRCKKHPGKRRPRRKSERPSLQTAKKQWPKPDTADNPLTGFGRPLLNYTAPYENLTDEIDKIVYPNGH